MNDDEFELSESARYSSFCQNRETLTRGVVLRRRRSYEISLSIAIVNRYLDSCDHESDLMEIVTSVE